MARNDERDVIYVERDTGSIKPVLFGLCFGLGLGLLFAPQSGEETRRMLNRRLRKVRALAEEKVDEIGERLSSRQRVIRDSGPTESVRDDLERKLAHARSRRRAAVAAGDDEEPLA